MYRQVSKLPKKPQPIVRPSQARPKRELEERVIRSSDYHRRAVIFIDILGFRKLIERTLTDPDVLQKVNAALYEISDLAKFTSSKADWGSVISKEFYDHRGLLRKMEAHDFIDSACFSDSIVLSAVVGLSFGIASIFYHASSLALTLLRMGVLVRGGCAIGLLTHHGNIVFGPALIDAYVCESTEAIFPRIILPDGVGELIFFSKSADVLRDVDGKMYLDILAHVGSEELLHFRDMIENMLSNGSNVGIRKKLEWFASYIERKKSGHQM